MRSTLTVIAIVGALLAVTRPARLVSQAQSIPQIPAPKPLTSPVTIAEELRAVPSIAGDGKNLIVIWSYELSSNHTWWLAYRHSNDGGLSFGSPQKLVRLTYPQGFKTYAADGIVHVCWQDELSPAVSQVSYAHIDLASGKGSRPIQLSKSTENALQCQVSASDRTVFVFWQDEVSPIDHRLVGALSADQGATFSSAKEIGRVVRSPGRVLTNIANSRSTAFVSWTDEVNSRSRVVFASFNSSSSQPIESQTISTAEHSGCCPDIFTSGDSVLIAWSGIRVSRSNDGGRTFLPAVSLEQSAGLTAKHFMWPQLGASKNNVYLIFQETSPFQQIYFSYSRDGGASFSRPRNLSENDAYATSPKFFAFTDKVVATWEEIQGQEFYVAMCVSKDQGRTFTAPTRIRVNAKEGRSFGGVSVFANTDALFFVWPEVQAKWNEKLVQLLRIGLD
jgi:hypothetical protein